MRIGYFIHKNWYPPRAGSGIHAYQLANHLARRGHTIQSIFTEYDDPIVRRYAPRQLFPFLRATDVIYIRIFGAYQTGKFAFLKLLKMRRCPVIWEVNAPLEEQLLTGKSRGQVARLQHERTLLARLVDGCICNTPALADYARSRWRIAKCFVVPLGSDEQLFAPGKQSDRVYADLAGRFKVVWAGTPQYRWHGLPMLFEIAKRMERIDPDVTFVAIGKREGLQKYGVIPSNMTVIGEVPYLEMPAYLASADAGLCIYEESHLGIDFYRSPLKLFDYMAVGLPVIATSEPEIARIVRHGESGLLTGKNAAEIIDAILQLKRDQAAARAMGAAARQAIIGYYNWRRVAADTEKVLQRLR